MNSKLFSKIVIVILISLSIGLIYIYPDLRFIYELKKEFKGVTLTATADELGYLARIKAVYKGNLTCKGVDLYEHKNAPWAHPFLSELVEGSIGRLLRIDIIWLDILMSFILPLILFWLTFLLFVKLTDSTGCAYLGSAFFLLGYDLFTATPKILKEILLLHSYPKPLWFLRPITPQLNYIALILSVLMIYMSITKRKVFYILSCSISVGLLFYIHPHYWTFIYASLAVLLLSFFIVKDRVGVRIILAIGAISLLISIPFWSHAYSLMFNPNYSIILDFTGLLHTRSLILPPFHVVLTAFIIGVLLYLKDRDLLFITSFLIGGILCLNQQLLTGVTLIPGHWQGYTNKTLIMIVLIVTLFKGIKKFGQARYIFALKRMKTGFFLGGIIFLYAAALLQQSSYYKIYKENFRNRQAIAAAYAWINRNADPDDVILTDPFNYPDRSPYNFEVLTYTNCYTYLPLCYTSLISRDEYEGRLLYAFRFFKYSLKEVDLYLTYAGGAYFIGLKAIPEYGGKAISQAEISRLEEKYSGLQLFDIIEVIKRYRVNYVMIDKKGLSKYNKEISEKRLRVVYEDKNFGILKVL